MERPARRCGGDEGVRGGAGALSRSALGAIRERRGLAALVLLALAAAALQIAAYWPGILIWDSIRQYREALAGQYDDWHPPAMDWLWRQLTAIHKGPAPMLLLQTGMLWGGLMLLAARAERDGRLRLGLAILAAGLLPIPFALMGAITKDGLMAGALLLAVGLAAWRWRVAAGLLLIAAATIRFNAFFAEVPLALMLLPAAWRAGTVRLGLATIAVALPLVAALPLANALLRAEPSGVGLSLVIFDLGGITEQSGADAFPPQTVADPVAVNHLCYDPAKWDSYAWWVEEPCPMGFNQLRDAFAKAHISPTGWWLRAIAAHPVAYAAHRLAHFSINSRFLIHGPPNVPVFRQTDPNEWGYGITQNGLFRVIDRIAVASEAAPIGWPIWWMAVAAGVLLLSPFVSAGGAALPLAWSSLLYGLGYLPLSVASEMRYHLWTMLAALLAAILAAAAIDWRGVPRARLVAAALPLLIVTALASAWRLG
ncbi:hypothetical protein Q4F19_13955 [Sphingomonas sp. BIUV-7]|uniref:Glycosyltransferase RgtA/B/C/D-like domain-containing protein n=1 Tax=Sphingomonas natans TaxID=3063330 RepID=A0ABT8YAX9_9SPHN|nr:hypothetical protein [Sphingomonas sp. BIUV-7]MDO6415492.1 hypothetical protein [Sphingomonas sp. BIUV-7]